MAGDSGSSSAPIRRDWRDRGTASGSSRGARNTKRFIYTALTISLVGVLIWYLLLPNQQVHFAFLAANYGPKMGKDLKKDAARFAPPLVDDVTADFDRMFGKLGETLHDEQFVLQNLRGGFTSRNAAEHLANTLDLDGADTLILYINAHCVAIGGEPYLLWNQDYGKKVFARDKKEGPRLFKLSELLGAIHSLEVQQKLLLLDCGQLAADPRSGLFVNEFPALLRKEVAKSIYQGDGIKSSDLWVIASHSPFETSHVWRETRHSIFAHHVAGAIRGGPWTDKDSTLGEDEDMSLYDFFEYIQRHVSLSVERGSQYGSQTPMFLVGGESQEIVAGVNFPAAKLLLKVSYREPPVAAIRPKQGESKRAAQRSRRNPNAINFVAEQREPSGNDKRKRLKTPGSLRRSAIWGAKVDGIGHRPSSRTSLALFYQQPETSGAVDDSKSQGEKEEQTKDKESEARDDARRDDEKERKKEDDLRQDADKAPDKKEKPKDVFDEIWNLCEQIENPDGAESFWSPVDYAPHQWSKLRHHLIWYRMRYLLETSDRKANDQFLKQEILAPLGRILEGKEVTSRLPVFARLDQARVAFEASPYGHDFSGKTSFETKEIQRAIRVRNYAWYQVGHLTRHYGRLDDPQGETYARLVETIADLRSLSSQLEQLEDKTLSSLSTSGVPRLVDKLNRQRQHMTTSRDLAEIVLADGTASFKGIHSPGTRPEGAITDPAISRWGDLYLRLIGLEHQAEDRANLDEIEIFKRGDPKIDRAVVERHIKTLRDGIEGRLTKPEDHWSAVREIGRLVKAYYASLATRIRSLGGSSAGPEENRQKERLLRLVDARDVKEIGIRDNPIPHRRWRPRIDSVVEFVDFKPEINLGPKQNWPLEFRIKWNGPKETKARVTLEYDDPVKGFDVVLINGALDETTFGAMDGVIDAFSITAKPFDTAKMSSLSAKLILKVAPVGKPPFIKKFTVNIFGREFVEVELTEVPDPKDPSQDRLATEGSLGRYDLTDAEGKVVANLTTSKIRPMPNRAAEYRLKLKNLSGQVDQRQVEVKLTLITEPVKAPRDAFRNNLSLDVNHRRLPQLTRNLTLSRGEWLLFPFIVEPDKPKPGDDQADDAQPLSVVTASFQPPKRDAPAAAKGKKPPPLGDARYGLVIDIQDKQNPENRWIHWFDFRPRLPEYYIKPIVNYDNSGNLLIRLEPVGDLRSHRWFKASLSVDHIKSEIEGLPQKLEVEADKDHPEAGATLYINNYFPKRNDRFRSGNRPIYISVDGHPRAFIFELDPGRPGPLRRRENYRNLNIVKPVDWQVYGINLDPTAPAAGATEIIVELEADSGAEDPIQVSFSEGQPTIRTLASDRAEHAVITEVGEQGIFTVDVKVGDFKGDDALRFKTSTTEQFMAINADIVADPGDHNSQRLGRRHDDQNVIVDGSPPRVGKATLKADRPVAGKPLRVSAKVTDPGGVATVKFYVLPNGEPFEDPAKIVATTARSVGDQKTPIVSAEWTALLNTEELMLIAEREYALWVVVKDRAGHSRKTRIESFRLEKPRVVIVDDGPAAPAKKGITIQGQAFYSERSRPGIEIILTPTGDTKGKPRKATTKAVLDPLGRVSGAQYVITDVPIGTYQLTAAGRLGIRDLEQLDPVRVTVDSLDEQELTVDVKLTRK